MNRTIQISENSTGYVSTNPLTILANVLRSRPITSEQSVILKNYPFTPAEIVNVEASVAAYVS